jgi:hypothetical protein
LFFSRCQSTRRCLELQGSNDARRRADGNWAVIRIEANGALSIRSFNTATTAHFKTAANRLLGAQRPAPAAELSARCGIGQATFPRTDRNGQDAPFPAVRGDGNRTARSDRQPMGGSAEKRRFVLYSITLVGAGEEQLRHGDAERLGGLQVDHHL